MEESEIDLRELLGVLRRQLRLILLTVVLITGVAAAYVLTATPRYTAETLILVDPQQKNILDPSEQLGSGSASENAKVDSEVEILRSPAMALAVVLSADLISDPEFGPRISTRDKLLTAIGFAPTPDASGDAIVKKVINRFLDAREVSRKGRTYVISASVTSENPERAARLANALAQTYIEEQIAAKVANSLGARDVLERQIITAQQSLANSEDRLNNFISDNLDRLEEESGQTAIAGLRAELERIESQRLQSSVLVENAAAALAARDWASVGATLQSQALAELERERRDLQSRLERSVEGSQVEIDLKAALADVEAGLEREAGNRIAALRSEVVEFDTALSGYRDDIRATLLRSDLSSQTVAEVFRLQQDAEIARRQYQTLLSRMSDLETQAAVQLADSRIVSEALPPTSASYPRKTLVLALALVLAIGVGAGLAFANEYYVGGITSEDQLAHILQQRVAATIPLVQMDRDQHSLADLVVTQPLSAYAEAFRRLRATIDQTMRAVSREAASQEPLVLTGDAARRGKVILVCSSVPAEGKTTTALALARTYAQSGVSTILIDADLRKPTLHRQLNVKTRTSLLDFLTGAAESDTQADFYLRDPMSTMQAFVGAGRSSVPTDQLLVGTRFNALVSEMREVAEVVIIDSSPLLPVVDARYIAPLADAIVMMVRYATTSQSDLRASAAQLVEAINPGTPVFGCLTHEVRPKKAYRYQGYYADYTSG